MALPAHLNQALEATAALTVAELYNEGKSAANNPEEWPLAQISERLDGRTCPLCRAVDGKILKVGSPEYRQWRQPSHINCRRVMVYIHRDEQGAKPDFREPDAELIRKHGHYHLRPDRHAELRIPAEPAGRHVIVRRVRNLETGEISTRLDWAPWHEQHSEATRKLIVKARGTADPAELERILAELGVTNFNDPEQLRRVVLLGLRDRVEGWITLEETPFERAARTIERKIAKRAQERAWIITPEGKTVYRKIGRRSEITFRPDEQVHFEGNVFIHNHPGGTSFSPADVETAAKSGAVEFRLVTAKYRYILRPPAGGWPPNWWEETGEALFELHRGQVEGELRQLVRQGIMSEAEYEAARLDLIWERVAQDAG
ncbi:MAG TPA: hypothetical protein VFU47_11615, partial [Armatimonadota bacterium]|nr:hypothetical protein [Armatimonadota bacterium]